MGALFRRIFIESLTMPRIAARRVIGLNISPLSLAQIGAVALIVSVLVGQVADYIVPTEVPPGYEVFVNNPIWLFVMQYVSIFILAWLIIGIGRLYGGEGRSWQDALALSVLLYVVTAVMQIVQIFLVIIFMPLGLILLLFSIYWFFWALCVFVAEFHGFTNMLKVFGGVVMSFIMVVFSIAILLLMSGIMPVGKL